MKVKEIINKINDTKIYIEIKYTQKDGGGTFRDFYKKWVVFQWQLKK